MEKHRTDRIIPVITAVIGTAAGSILAMLYPTLSIWQSPVFRQGYGIEPTSFLSLLGFSCLALCVAAAAGLSVCGSCGVSFAVFSKAAALGAVLAEYYKTDGFAGFLTSLLFVLPFGFGCMLILVYAASEAICGARWLTRAVLHAIEGEYPLRRYALHFWVLALIQTGLTAAQYCVLSCYPAYLSFMIH